ncbi:hypothetical protein BH10PSE6_BH10PSE6_22470 [soil metagenome]
MKRFIGITAAALMLSFAPGAQAHHLWLEVDASGVRIYFGEFGENLREASPGTLDKLQPSASIAAPSGNRPLEVGKTANGFAVSGKIEAGDSIVAEDTRYPVFERKRDGTTTRSIYRPAARFVPDRAPRTATLDLDVVPVADGKYQVVFKGKPLAKTKVEVITPSGWGREVQTGEDGGFEVALPWRGAYVLEVHHNDRTPGKRGEEAYDIMNYVTSLTVVQPDGLPPVPAPPPAKPQ